MRCLIALAAAVCVCFAPTLLSQTPTVEGQVKAAVLFNFAQFIQWPSQSFPDRDAPFTLCAIGDPFEGILEKTVEGETLNGRRIVVRRLTSTDNLRGCHLAYVGTLEARRSTEIISAANRVFAAEGTPVLTVGDADDFIDIGGMIRFTEVGSRVRFEINPDAAERVSLRVSSRLLRLADIVSPRQGLETK